MKLYVYLYPDVLYLWTICKYESFKDISWTKNACVLVFFLCRLSVKRGKLRSDNDLKLTKFPNCLKGIIPQKSRPVPIERDGRDKFQFSVGKCWFQVIPPRSRLFLDEDGVAYTYELIMQGWNLGRSPPLPPWIYLAKTILLIQNWKSQKASNRHALFTKELYLRLGLL